MVVVYPPIDQTSKRMKISVVTPSLNQGDFIEDNILSVLNQNYADFEHIIIDGGSTDNTIDILKRYRHIKWISEPDRGMAEALNKGFKRAKGQWILWLNADDFLLKGIFQKVMNIISVDHHAEIVYGNWLIVDKNKNIIKPGWAKDFNLNEQIYIGITPTSGTFFKNSVFKEGLLIDERFQVCMDVEFITRLGNKGKKFLYIPEFFSCFRIHGGNISFDHHYYYDKKYSRFNQSLMILRNIGRYVLRSNKERMRDEKWRKRVEQRKQYSDLYQSKTRVNPFPFSNNLYNSFLFGYYSLNFILYKIRKGCYKKRVIKRTFEMQALIPESTEKVRATR